MPTMTHVNRRIAERIASRRCGSFDHVEEDPAALSNLVERYKQYSQTFKNAELLIREVLADRAKAMESRSYSKLAVSYATLEGLIAGFKGNKLTEIAHDLEHRTNTIKVRDQAELKKP